MKTFKVTRTVQLENYYEIADDEQVSLLDICEMARNDEWWQLQTEISIEVEQLEDKGN